MTRHLAILLAVGIVACGTPPEETPPPQTPPPETGFPSGRIVDLTHPFDEKAVYWPTAEGFTLQVVAHGVMPQGYFYAANRFSAAEHGGTHIDAPVHFWEGGRTVDQIPPEQLVGPGIVVNVSEKCLTDRDYQVRIEDLTGWEQAHGTIPEGAIVMLRTGFGRFWPERARYMGTDKRGASAVQELHFPGLHPEAAAWLGTERSIAAVGLDTPSIDHGPSIGFEAHVALFERNIPALENVANLHELPEEGFTVIALPMKIAGGSGAPTRIIAVVP